MKNNLQSRKRFCLELAEQINYQFNLLKTEFDIDQCAKLIDSLLPYTYNESIEVAEEIDEAINEIVVPKQPGLLQQLRIALGFDEKVSLNETLQAAIEKITEKTTI